MQLIKSPIKAITLLCLLVILQLSNCRSNSGTQKTEQRELVPFTIRGIAFAAPIHEINDSVFFSIKDVNANSIAVMPYAFCDEDNPTVRYNHPRQWWGETDEGVRETIIMAKKAGLSVMIKPHLWLRYGGYTGKLSFDSEAAWKEWEQSYRAYIMHFVALSDSLGSDIFCLGTELGSVVKERSDFFKTLIDDVRKSFRGKITYAANWDDYNKFPFWSLLDMIGIDAYFPLSEGKTPSIKSIEQSWSSYEKALHALSEKERKKILFAEYGYRNVDFATKHPWEESQGEQNDEAQVNALQAFYNIFSSKDWVEGGYLWKWYPDKEQLEYSQKIDYTVQGKSAIETVKNFYGSMRK